MKNLRIGAVVTVQRVAGDFVRPARDMETAQDVVLIDMGPADGTRWGQMLAAPDRFVIVTNGKGREKGRILIKEHVYGAGCVDVMGRAAMWPVAARAAVAA